MIQVGKHTEVLAERRFYDDTYLVSTDGSGVVAFICDAAFVRYQSGREAVRTKRDVIDYPTADALVAAIRKGGWVEAPLDENRRWTPTPEQIQGRAIRITDE